MEPFRDTASKIVEEAYKCVWQMGYVKGAVKPKWHRRGRHPPLLVLLQNSGSQSVILWPAGLAPRGNLSEMHIQGPYSDPLNQPLEGWGPGNCFFIFQTFLGLIIYFNFGCIGSSLWRTGSVARGILIPWPGIKLASLALQGRFLTTGPPGKPPGNFFLTPSQGGIFVHLSLRNTALESAQSENWLNLQAQKFSNLAMYFWESIWARSES